MVSTALTDFSYSIFHLIFDAMCGRQEVWTVTTSKSTRHKTTRAEREEEGAEGGNLIQRTTFLRTVVEGPAAALSSVELLPLRPADNHRSILIGKTLLSSRFAHRTNKQRLGTTREYHRSEITRTHNTVEPLSPTLRPVKTKQLQ